MFIWSVEMVRGLWTWLFSVRRLGKEGKMTVRQELRAGERLSG